MILIARNFAKTFVLTRLPEFLQPAVVKADRLLSRFPFTSVARRFGLDQAGARPPAWAAPALA